MSNICPSNDAVTFEREPEYVFYYREETLEKLKKTTKNGVFICVDVEKRVYLR